MLGKSKCHDKTLGTNLLEVCPKPDSSHLTLCGLTEDNSGLKFYVLYR